MMKIFEEGEKDMLQNFWHTYVHIVGNIVGTVILLILLGYSIYWYRVKVKCLICSGIRFKERQDGFAECINCGWSRSKENHKERHVRVRGSEYWIVKNTRKSWPYRIKTWLKNYFFALQTGPNIQRIVTFAVLAILLSVAFFEGTNTPVRFVTGILSFSVLLVLGAAAKTGQRRKNTMPTDKKTEELRICLNWAARYQLNGDSPTPEEFIALQNRGFLPGCSYYSEIGVVDIQPDMVQ